MELELKSKLVVFKDKELNDLLSPLVYVFVNVDRRSKTKEEILYIGVSSNGISRPLDKHHQMAKVRKLANEIRIYVCDSKLEAYKLEKELILKYKASYGRGNTNLDNLIIKKCEEEEKKKLKDCIGIFSLF